MNHKTKLSDGIGRKLILSIGIILLFTVLSVNVSTIAISKIDASRDNLTKNSIPALVEVGHLSRVAVNIIKQSQMMNAATSHDDLDQQMDETSLSIKSLLEYLTEIKRYGLSSGLSKEFEEILENLDKNVVELYQLVSKKLDFENTLIQEISTMRNSIETIEDKAAFMKINADHEFLSKLNNIDVYEPVLVKNIFQEEINDIELVSSVIMRSGELRKDLNAINQAVNNESILFIQQEFNHSLRKIIRTIVQSKNVKFHEDIRNNIAILIEYGQDSPDIFDHKKEIILISQRLEMISQENIVHTQRLNTAVFSLANEVKYKAESASGKLHDTIVTSRATLFVIAFIALIVSLIVSWQFIYKRIVIKLAELSSITKKLANNDFDFDFEIDMEGDDELSDIAIALESLKEHSLKRISMNKILSKNSLKLKQSNEDLSQFAYIASHDLQEPLRMVGSYVQLLESRYKNKLDEDAHIYVEYAVDGCVRMKALIEGLLEYSHVESNDEEWQEVNCDLIINEVVQDLSVQINERSAKIIVEQLPNVFAIPTQVRIVFANLISNALKYCEQNNPRVEIQSKLVQGSIQFSIKDNGIGIKPQYQQKIFVIFKRLHSRAEYSGTGIGLSICKKIIERHGGKISLESTFGVGTTFFFTLPASQSMRSIDDHKLAV